MNSHKSIRGAGTTILAGSALGFGITFLLTPAISRTYAPEVYGTYATITATASVFIGASTLRLEVKSQRVAEDAEAAALRRMALHASLVWMGLLTLVSAIAVLVWGASPWWLTLGPLVALASLQLIGTAALTRARQYRRLALFNFVQGAGLGVTQVCLGISSAAVGSLIAGFAIARLGWLTAIRRGKAERPPVKNLWSRTRRFAAFAGSSALVNSLAGQLPVLLISAMYGATTVGQFAMATRLLISPLSIVGQAVAAASIGEVGKLLREGDPSAARVVRRSMRDLFAVGVVPCAIAGILGIWATSLFLGSVWRDAGVMVALLSAGALAQFAVGPFSQLLNLAGANRALLAWDGARFAAILLSFVVPWWLQLPMSWTIGAYSIILVVLYLILARLAVRAVESVAKERAS